MVASGANAQILQRMSDEQLKDVGLRRDQIN
jgi:uncharacterized protein YjiS (DUF1127 family)